MTNEHCTRRCARVTPEGICDWCANRTARALNDMSETCIMLYLARVPAGGTDAKVSGSREMPAPVRAEVLDHLDVIGSTAASWCAQVAEDRELAGPTNHNLSGHLTFLRAHHDWAVQQPWAIDYAEEIQDCAHEARILARLYQPRPQILDGIQCRSPRCDLVGVLFRSPESRYVECAACGNLLTEAEYAEWTGMLASAAKQDTKAEVTHNVTAEAEAC